MKLSNTNNNSAASNFCLMDSILFEIMSCFIRTIVKYKDDLFVILEKLPLSCWIVNNKQPHARIQILFPGGPKDIYVLGRGDQGRFSVVLRITFKTFEFSTVTPSPFGSMHESNNVLMSNAYCNQYKNIPTIYMYLMWIN